MKKYRIVKTLFENGRVIYRVETRSLFFFWTDSWVAFSNQREAEEYIDRMHYHDAPEKSVKIIPYVPKS